MYVSAEECPFQLANQKQSLLLLLNCSHPGRTSGSGTGSSCLTSTMSGLQTHVMYFKDFPQTAGPLCHWLSGCNYIV